MIRTRREWGARGRVQQDQGKFLGRAAVSADPAAYASRRPGDLLGCCVSSVGGVTLWCMEVTESLLARVPVGNLRVPRAEFGALWVEAERLNAEQTGRPIPTGTRRRSR